MSTCRICGSNYEPFIDFGKQPIANGFLTRTEFEKEYFFQMQVGFCQACGMVQLVDQPAPEQMFHENYAFFSGTSVFMQKHFKSFAQHVIKDYLPKENPFVVEIGSNDGIMLQNFKDVGIRHLGIEPSKNVADAARTKGINTISEFFNEELAKKIVAEYGQADAYLAANVMCHIGTFRNIVAGISTLVKKSGIVMFEDPYLGDVIEKTSYDQIYDEHVFLFSLASISHVFGLYGMEVVDVEPQETHGGSMRWVIAHKGAREISERVGELASREAALGLSKQETYHQFRANVEQSRDNLRSMLERFKAEGKSVAGYAATSKSTTVLNYCGIGPELIDYISDTTPIKQGKFSPGMHIPVKPYQAFKEQYPDAAVLFGWNHKKEIFAKEQGFLDAGGQWVMFVPKVEIVSRTILCGSPKAQYQSHKDEILAAVERVLEGGRYIGGEEVAAFESEFAKYLGLKHCVSVGNGTEALHLALRALDVGPGDEVITVSHTAVATVAAIEMCGATPVLVDVEPDTYTMDPLKVAEAISRRTKAIIPVHLYGQPVALDDIVNLARESGIKVVEDCAQAHGARWKGRQVGTFGDVACFSFYPTKNLGAAGDGGAVATSDAKIAEKLRLLKEYGWKDRYVSLIPGFNSRLDEIQATLLRVKLRYLDRDNQMRRAIAATYDAALRVTGIKTPYVRPDASSVFHLYVIEYENRKGMLDYLREHGVGALIHYPQPIHLQPAYKGRVQSTSMEATERAAERIISLPIYPELSPSEVLHVINCVKAFVGLGEAPRRLPALNHGTFDQEADARRKLLDLEQENRSLQQLISTLTRELEELRHVGETRASTLYPDSPRS